MTEVQVQDAPRLDARIQELLATKALGRVLRLHDVLTSTNDEAHRLAEQGAPHGAVVIAEAQTQGRGRRGRTWMTQPGKALALSVVLRTGLSPARASELSFVAAVAVCEAVRALGALHAKVKWPNDVEARGKKLAGLLLELRTQGDQVAHVVLGLGLNVNVVLEELPAELRLRTTSLRCEVGEEVSRALTCARVLGSLEEWLLRHETLGFEVVRERWKQLSSTIGQRVRVESAAPVEGQAVDLQPDGALLVQLASGERVCVVAGDVEHLRAQ